MIVYYYGNELPQGTILVEANTINKMDTNLETNIKDEDLNKNEKITLFIFFYFFFD